MKADPIEIVKMFHIMFEHPIRDFPSIPSEQRKDLRKKLLREEVEEFCTGVDHEDLLEILDALCDIQYVLAGAILEFGFGNNFMLAFKEVHRSNMSKSCATEEEAQRTIDKAYHEHGPCHYVKRNGRFFVYRTSDSKTIKSINYSPANLKKFCREQPKDIPYRT